MGVEVEIGDGLAVGPSRGFYEDLELSCRLGRALISTHASLQLFNKVWYYCGLPFDKMTSRM